MRRGITTRCAKFIRFFSSGARVAEASAVGSELGRSILHVTTSCNYPIGLLIVFLPSSVTLTWKCRPFRGLKSVTLFGSVNMANLFLTIFKLDKIDFLKRTTNLPLSIS